MTILGLDLSLSSTGHASLLIDAQCDRHVISGTIHSRPVQSDDPVERARMEADRLLEIASRARAIAEDHNLVVIEGVSMGSVGKLDALYGLHWVVRTRLPFSQLIVPPTTLKKFATGKGNSKKDEMRLAIYKNWGIEVATDDEVDAVALAYFGAAYMGAWECRNQAQREAVEVIRHRKPKKARKAANAKEA